MTERFLILEDGSIYPGQAFGSAATTTGQLIFNTNMTGYQETITNQIYHNQIVVFAQPTIGSTGITHDSYESILPTAKGMIVREVATISANGSRRLSLDQFLKQHEIPGISGIDTRQLIRHLRESEPMKASIVDVADDHAFDQLHATVLTNQQVSQVATPKPFANPNEGANIVVIDFGLKHGILRELSHRHANVTVLPWSASTQDVLNLDPDGVLLSSGPGSPKDLPESVLDMIQAIQTKIPLFGIGLGHELFALANGAAVTALPVEHHSSNHPIREIITGRIFFAMESEGYVIDDKSMDYDRLLTTHVDLINGSVQGLRHRDYPAFSVQFFPDGGPGPHDARTLFDEFIEITTTREVR